MCHGTFTSCSKLDTNVPSKPINFWSFLQSKCYTHVQVCCEWFQALFWIITQQVVAISYRCFRTTYWFNLEGPRGTWPLGMWLIILMFVLCIAWLGIIDQHCALIITPLFITVAPTCFGTFMPSSGSVLYPYELFERQKWLCCSHAL
jgi:hypothetical protein